LHGARMILQSACSLTCDVTAIRNAHGISVLTQEDRTPTYTQWQALSDDHRSAAKQ